MAGLDEQDMTVLANYARQGNRELYWNYLAHKEGNDGYGLLALGVVRNDNAPGATANLFADAQARRDGVHMSERQWNTFGVELMQADLTRRQAQMDMHRPDLALNLPVRDVQRVHDQTFRSHHIDPNGWTPRELLDAARRHGGEPEAEKTWTMMLDNTALGLSRMQSTSWDTMHRYNDGQLDATSYMARMGAARSLATQALPNTNPDQIGAESFYASYNRHTGQWSQTSIVDGMVSSLPVRDPGQLRELDDTRALRLEREQLRGRFDPEDAYRHAPIIKSPYLISDNAPDRREAPASVQQAALGTPDQPGHARHGLYQQCGNGVDALDRQLGRSPDQSSACMKASLTTLAAANGFERVDQVLLSHQNGHAQAGQHVFIVQGDPKDPGHLRAHMPTQQAATTPVETSFRELAQLEQQRQPSQQQHEQTLAQQHQAPSHGARSLAG